MCNEGVANRRMSRTMRVTCYATDGHIEATYIFFSTEGLRVMKERLKKISNCNICHMQYPMHKNAPFQGMTMLGRI